MAVATKFTPKKREKFLMLLGELGNVTKACELTNISRPVVYAYRRDHEDFRLLWDMAVELAADALEDEAWRRAKEGIDKPLQYQGSLTGDIITEYSDTLLIFLLKGNKPEKFRERIDQRFRGEMVGEATIIFESNGREVEK